VFGIGLGTVGIPCGAIFMRVTSILWMLHPFRRDNSLEYLLPLVVSHFLFGWTHSGWAIMLVLSWLLVAFIDDYQETLDTVSSETAKRP
jgi:hypothetical protein